MISLKSELEMAEYLQNMLIAYATDGIADDQEYKALRKHFMESQLHSGLLPKFVRTNRDLSQFWNFIKNECKKYQERREFIWAEFTPLLDLLEGHNRRPADPAVSDGLKSFDEVGIHAAWKKALDRRGSDPEGAITASRTLIEAVCKHILEAKGAKFDAGKTDLPELYKLTSKELNIAPSQHTEEIFRQILGGVTSVVSGLGSLRNKLGDAHGQGRSQVRPALRHAQLAVNLAGAVSLFLMETWESRNKD